MKKQIHEMILLGKRGQRPINVLSNIVNDDVVLPKFIIFQCWVCGPRLGRWDLKENRFCSFVD